MLLHSLLMLTHVDWLSLLVHHLSLLGPVGSHCPLLWCLLLRELLLLLLHCCKLLLARVPVHLLLTGRHHLRRLLTWSHLRLVLLLRTSDKLASNKLPLPVDKLHLLRWLLIDLLLHLVHLSWSAATGSLLRMLNWRLLLLL